jgi:tetratricopeptide (TPR) repeat protein
MDIPKKYWWVIGAAVPIVVAIIGIIPNFTPSNGSGEKYYVDVAETQFNGKVAFNNVTIVTQQTQQQLGAELPSGLVEKIQEAFKLIESKDFEEAIPVLESVAKAAPAPAILNNIGAAYLALGNKEKAISSFKKSLSQAPDQESARFNLSQAKPKPSTTPSKIDNESEPNNNPSVANKLLVETPIFGEISSKEDQDYFDFQNTSNYRDWVKVNFTNLSQTLAPKIFVYNQKKSEMFDKYDRTLGSDLEFLFVVEAGEHYYFKILHYKGTGKYKLSLNLQHTYDAYEQNDKSSSATLIKTGRSIVANILDEKDVDWYKVTGTKSKKLTVRFESQSDLAPDIVVYDYNKSKIFEKHDSTQGASLELSIDVESEKDYYLEVLSYEGRGKYTLIAN